MGFFPGKKLVMDLNWLAGLPSEVLVDVLFSVPVLQHHWGQTTLLSDNPVLQYKSNQKLEE